NEPKLGQCAGRIDDMVSSPGTRRRQTNPNSANAPLVSVLRRWSCHLVPTRGVGAKRTQARPACRLCWLCDRLAVLLVPVNIGVIRARPPPAFLSVISVVNPSSRARLLKPLVIFYKM